MINFEALIKVSYGLYIICSGDQNNGNGYIANTFFQLTSEPAKFATSCNKDNYSSAFIEENKHFSVSVLHQQTAPELFGRFGYKSGRDGDKLSGLDIKYGITNTPIVLNDSVAYFEFKLVDKIDVGTHWLFIGELVDAQIIKSDFEPITYEYYRSIKKGIAPKNAPTYIDKSKLEKKVPSGDNKKFKCVVCNHIYDEGKEKVKFNDLDKHYECPICGAEKEDFIEI